MDVVLLFALVIGMMMIGVPIAISLGLSSIIFLLLHSEASLPETGISTRKQLPRPGSLSTWITPRCARTMPSTAASPSPCPDSLELKKGSKTRATRASWIPSPVSETSSPRYSPGSGSEVPKAPTSSSATT